MDKVTTTVKWVCDYLACSYGNHKMVEKFNWTEGGHHGSYRFCERCGLVAQDEFRGIHYYSPAFEGYIWYSVPKIIVKLWKARLYLRGYIGYIMVWR